MFLTKIMECFVGIRDTTVTVQTIVDAIVNDVMEQRIGPGARLSEKSLCKKSVINISQ